MNIIRLIRKRRQYKYLESKLNDKMNDYYSRIKIYQGGTYYSAEAAIEDFSQYSYYIKYRDRKLKKLQEILAMKRK